MAKLKITHVELSTIIDRDTNQREKINDIEELADSILRLGLIHPIIIDTENRLVAGGRRLAAYRLLSQSHEGYTSIPTIQKSNLSDSSRRAIELEENIKRSQLDWKDECKAVVELDNILRAVYPDWKLSDRCAYIGVSPTIYSQYLAVGRAVLAGHERVLTAGGITAASNILSKENARKQDNVMNDLYQEITSVGQESDDQDNIEQFPKGSAEDYISKANPVNPGKMKKTIKPTRVIEQGNFLEWIKTYNGPKFNLIHCDFPYGIDHGNSDQGGAKTRWEAYEDSEDTYWQLIRGMLADRDRIMLPNCHIIFWFHMKFYQQTISAFNTLAPEMEVDYFPLIWHKTDNKGIIRDARHTPRHVYETAFLITRGDRQIIKAVGDAYGAPTRKSDSIHISEKPVPVLRHFMQLCVDGFSEVFDPTAGSGSALRAAHSMGAKRVYGLELNPDYADGAQREFEQQIAIDSLRKVEA